MSIVFPVFGKVIGFIYYIWFSDHYKKYESYSKNKDLGECFEAGIHCGNSGMIKESFTKHNLKHVYPTQQNKGVPNAFQ